MKQRFKLSAFLLLGLSAFLTSLEGQEEIRWLTDLDEARGESVAENKLIFLDCWAEWCEPCLRMDIDVWTQPEIVALSAKFVPVKIDVDRNRPTVRRLRLQNIPVIMILDGYGNKLHEVPGYRDAGEMTEIMDNLPADATRLHEFRQQVELTPDDAELLMSLGKLYGQSYLYQASNWAYGLASRLNEVKTDKDYLDEVETSMALNYYLMDETKKARRLLRKRLKAHPSSRNRPLQLYCLVKTNVRLGKLKRARGYLDDLRRKFPDDNHTELAAQLFQGQ